MANVKIFVFVQLFALHMAENLNRTIMPQGLSCGGSNEPDLSVDQLCDGKHDCRNGEDEFCTTNNKYYGSFVFIGPPFNTYQLHPPEECFCFIKDAINNTQHKEICTLSLSFADNNCRICGYQDYIISNASICDDAFTGWNLLFDKSNQTQVKKFDFFHHAEWGSDAETGMKVVHKFEKNYTDLSKCRDINMMECDIKGVPFCVLSADQCQTKCKSNEIPCELRDICIAADEYCMKCRELPNSYSCDGQCIERNKPCKNKCVSGRWRCNDNDCILNKDPCVFEEDTFTWKAYDQDTFTQVITNGEDFRIELGIEEGSVFEFRLDSHAKFYIERKDKKVILGQIEGFQANRHIVFQRPLFEVTIFGSVSNKKVLVLIPAFRHQMSFDFYPIEYQQINLVRARAKNNNAIVSGKGGAIYFQLIKIAKNGKIEIPSIISGAPPELFHGVGRKFYAKGLDDCDVDSENSVSGRMCGKECVAHGKVCRNKTTATWTFTDRRRTNVSIELYKMKVETEILVAKLSLEDCRSQFKLSTADKNISIWLSFRGDQKMCRVYEGKYSLHSQPLLTVTNAKLPVGIAVAEDVNGDTMLYLETNDNLVEVGIFKRAKRPWTLLELDGFEEVYGVTARLSSSPQSCGFFDGDSCFLGYGIVGGAVFGLIIVVILASVLARKRNAKVQSKSKTGTLQMKEVGVEENVYYDKSENEDGVTFEISETNSYYIPGRELSDVPEEDEEDLQRN